MEAPVGEGDVFGYLVYTLDGEELGRVAVTAEEPVERAGFPDCLKKAVSYTHLDVYKRQARRGTQNMIRSC